MRLSCRPMETGGQSNGRGVREQPPSARRGYQLAVLVLVGSLLLVVLYARVAAESERQLAQADFEARATLVLEQLRQQLVAVELTARGGVSLFASVDWPTARQWEDYVDSLRLDKQGLPLQGLGYAAWLTAGELSTLQQQRRAAGLGLYRVDPHGERDRYGPVVYLEPDPANGPMRIGSDLYADPGLSAAMAASRDSGEPRLGLADGRPAGGAERQLVLFLPVYTAGHVPAGVTGRRSTLQGWVHAPVDVAALTQAARAQIPSGPQLRLLDVGPGNNVRELYSDLDMASAAAVGAQVHQVETEVYGRRWQIEFRAAPGGQTGSSGLQATLLTGLLASVLLFAVVWALARTQAVAEQLAARMSESYRRSELRFRAALEYSAIGKALLDREGRIVEANPALAATFGIRPADLTGRPFDQVFTDPDPESGSDQDGVTRTTRQLRRSDGSLRQVQLSYAPVPGDIGSGVVRLVQMEDVTERLQAMAEIRRLNRTLEARVKARTRELEHANAGLESFAYSVSHDLRAPLRAIDGFGRIVSDRYHDVLDETGRDYLARIRSATARMDALIDALLAMARVSRAELRRGLLDLSGMVMEIRAELEAGDPERKVDWVVEPGMQATGDPALIRNLLENLIGNAWKFTSGCARARIEVGCEPGGPAGAFFVRDNGAGFAPEYADKLFRPFQRLHSQQEFSGHGIGLASARRIIDRHGGSIRAEGALGEGACFHFSLPGEGSCAD